SPSWGTTEHSSCGPCGRFACNKTQVNAPTNNRAQSALANSHKPTMAGHCTSTERMIDRIWKSLVAHCQIGGSDVASSADYRAHAQVNRSVAWCIALHRWLIPLRVTICPLFNSLSQARASNNCQ